MKCYIHNDRDAVGVCRACGRATCQECSVSFQGKMYCKQCLESQPRRRRRY